MSSGLAGWLQFLLLFAALAACYIPLGNYIAHIFTDKNHWRVEKGTTCPPETREAAPRRTVTGCRLSKVSVTLVMVRAVSPVRLWASVSAASAKVSPLRAATYRLKSCESLSSGSVPDAQITSNCLPAAPAFPDSITVRLSRPALLPQ